MSARQLGLPFGFTPGYGHFLPAESNAAALAWLGRAGEWPDGRLALWGEAGCGKSHLLWRWAAAAGASVRDGTSLAPDETGAVAIDDADGADEHALLHRLNGAAQAGDVVLLAARAAPARWTVSLADLRSRLRSVTAVGIGPAEETLLRALLASLLAERQIAVSETVQGFLLSRLPRTAAAMREAASRLDQASLAAGRAVTRTIAAEVVAAMEAGRDP